MKLSWFTVFQVYSKVIQFYIHIYIFWALFHYRLLQDTEYSALVIQSVLFVYPRKERFLKIRWGRGLQGTWSAHDILLIGWGWGNQESISLAFWFHLVWSLAAGGKHVVNVYGGEGARNVVSAKPLYMAQDIIDSPWGGTKGPWLCFMAKLLLLCLAWLFPFVSAFSHFSHYMCSLESGEGLEG